MKKYMKTVLGLGLGAVLFLSCAKGLNYHERNDAYEGAKWFYKKAPTGMQSDRIGEGR